MNWAKRVFVGAAAIGIFLAARYITLSRSELRGGLFEAPVRLGVPVPPVVLQSQSGPRLVNSLVSDSSHRPLVLVMMSIGCQSCNADLPVWDATILKYKTNAHYVLIVCATDYGEASDFAAKSKAFRESYLCDDNVRATWQLGALPAVLVLDSLAAPRFIASGPKAAENFDGFMADAPNHLR